MLRQSMAKSGKVLTPYRAGVTTDGLKHNKFRSRCFGRAPATRAGGCDIHAAFDSPTGLIYPALETGTSSCAPAPSPARSPSIRDGQGARGVFVDAATGTTMEARARVVVVGASTLESARLLLNSKSARTRTGSATPAATWATTSAST
jgi:hypothetical protein